jgi:hypothetical protein
VSSMEAVRCSQAWSCSGRCWELARVWTAMVGGRASKGIAHVSRGHRNLAGGSHQGNKVME